jgi:hypothetical protein
MEIDQNLQTGITLRLDSAGRGMVQHLGRIRSTVCVAVRTSVPPTQIASAARTWDFLPTEHSEPQPRNTITEVATDGGPTPKVGLANITVKVQ